ncbi:MAG: acyltransferase family protein [Rhodoluna sp.]
MMQGRVPDPPPKGMTETASREARKALNSSLKKYRPEIDGLRAFAVVAVIINHFKKDLLPSGYLGVDIFFVISGYVITSSLAGRESKNFLDFLTGFYERRIKRLVPALVVFVLVTGLLISFFNPDPGGALGLGWKSLLGVSNITLYRSSTDYFAQSTELNPYTHTWSLGVEEQFYLLFPFLIWFSGFGRQATNGARNLFLWVGALTIISFVGFGYFYQRNQSAAYFLMPFRFWVMAAGCLLFIGFQKRARIERILEQVPPLLVVTAMVGMMFLPVSAAVPATIGIVVLSAILIASLKKGTAAYRVFTLDRVVFIGLISYSLYLWHWSVLSISRWTIGVHWWSVPIQVGLMFIVALGSYRWIETPYRKLQWSLLRWKTIGVGLIPPASAAALIIGYVKTEPFSLFLGSKPQLIATGVSSLTAPYSLKAQNREWSWKGEKCVLSDNSQVGKVIRIEDCTIGSFEEADRRILILGNSFSTAFTHAFERLVKDRKYAVTITSSWGASPIKEIPNKTTWDKANDFYWTSTVPRLTKQLRAGDIVFLVNDMAGFSPKEKSGEIAKNLELLGLGLTRFSTELKARGITLAILNGNPFAREAGCKPESAVKQWYSPFGHKKCAIPDRKATLERRKELDELLNKVSADSGVKIVDLLDVFCPFDKCTYYAKDGSILYRDEYSHPSVEAAKLSGDVFYKLFTDDQIGR